MNRSANVDAPRSGGAFIASALGRRRRHHCPANGKRRDRVRRAACPATASGVMADAGTYLAGHPDADKVLTRRGNAVDGRRQGGGRSPTSWRHPGEFLDLKRIAQPLTDLRAQCGVAVSPGQLAALVESFQ